MSPKYRRSRSVLGVKWRSIWSQAASAAGSLTVVVRHRFLHALQPGPAHQPSDPAPAAGHSLLARAW